MGRIAARWFGATILALLWASAPGAPAAQALPAAPASPGVRTCDGVSVVVDFGLLATEGFRACAPLAPEASMTALEVLAAAGVDVAGTAQWGTAFICRVEGRPAATEEIHLPGGGTVLESCSRTPSQQAYWSLWSATGTGDWLYATSGAGDLQLDAGDVVGLAFTTGTAAAGPPALPAAQARSGDLPRGWVDRDATGPDDAGDPGSASPDAAPSPEQQGKALLPFVALGVVVVGGVSAAVVARRRR